MADARICDCCRKVFGNDEKVSEPIYRLLIYDQKLSTQERRSVGLGAYKEPELCPACVEKLFDLISESEFGEFDK